MVLRSSVRSRAVGDFPRLDPPNPLEKGEPDVREPDVEGTGCR